MGKLSQLQPTAVWQYFEEICQVPRPSKKEEKIIDFLLNFGNTNNLNTKRDEIGNVLISKPATSGMENRKPVILQSHIDMVCEKNNDVTFNFDTDPIRPFIDGNWVKAEGTTLGADDGIGIATQMAILTATDIEHGPIECLFTVDEETGLTGAFELQAGFFESKILLNLDSEDEGELFIGCAGGVDTIATFEYDKEEIPEGYVAIKLNISGLKGGHSGDEINKGLGNSNKILNRFLYTYGGMFGLRLAEFDGGNLRNAIPREAFAVICLQADQVSGLTKEFESYSELIKSEFAITEPDIKFSYTDCELPTFVINEETQSDLVNALYACPHGVIAMSQSIEGLVETSTNLASVKLKNDDQIIVTTSQRSSVGSAIDDVANMVNATFTLANAEVEHTDGYPGWAPNTNSEILKTTEEAYERLFSKKPLVRAIHAGLECGLFLEKYPELDMISFGPTIRGAHSPDERIDIETTQKFWDLLLEVLKNIK